MRYEIKGTPYPVAEVYLGSNESVICQSGAMVWQDPNVQMQTTTNGGVGKMLGRLVTGESLFQNTYTAKGGSGSITFGASVPGEIKAFELTPGDIIIAQKSAFLASDPTINFELFFQKKISSGFFGGEGFIMQKFTGSGTLLIEVDGSTVEKIIPPGESLLIDTGYLVATEGECAIEVETIKGVANVLMGGEGLFNTKVTAPKSNSVRIWLQTMPLSHMAAAIVRFIPRSN